MMYCYDILLRISRKLNLTNGLNSRSYKLETKSFIFISILLLFYLNFSNADEKCRDGEIYHNAFQRCCDDNKCKEGYYYNCSKCLPCPDNTYNDAITHALDCKPFTVCTEGQLELFHGNSTHDRVCDKNGDRVTDSPTTVVPSTETPPFLTSANTTTSPAGAPPGISTIKIALFASLGVVIIIVLVGGGLFAFIKRKSTERLRQKQSSHQKHPLLPDDVLEENEFVIAKKNIKQNYVQITRDMKSDRGFFWAALKEGNDAYTNDEQETFLKTRSSIERSGNILNRASNNESKLRSLIYALVVSQQGHLAELISKSMNRKTKVPKPWNPEGDEKQRLKNNRVYILENIIMDATFWAYLRERDVFSLEDEETCKNLNVQTAQTDYIIELILRGDDRKLESFKTALRETHTSLFEELTGRPDSLILSLNVSQSI